MNVGILGSGSVAKALGQGFIDREHQVMLGSRTPEQLSDWVGEIGRGANAGTFQQAAAFGEIVVAAVKGTAVVEALNDAGEENLDGKVLIDVTNPLEFHSGAPPTLAFTGQDSGGERIQAACKGAKVVKTLNIVNAGQMVNPGVDGGPPTMFVAGDDDGAKQEVAGLLADFGWEDVIDIGRIDASRELEALCVLWVRYAVPTQDWNAAFRLLRG